MKFSKKEIDFLLKEGNIIVHENESRIDVLAKAWEIAAEVETEEANNTTDEEYEANGDCLNDRGMMAVSLVDKLCWSGYREGEILNLDKLTKEMFEFVENEIGITEEEILAVDKDEELRQYTLSRLSELKENENGDRTGKRKKMIDEIRKLLIYRPKTVDKD